MKAERKKPDGYDRLKQYKGGGYSGMKVGGSHKWYYDQGVWKERKVTPDEWKIFYQTTKRRAGQAPEKSGAPVGTKYNWLIISHQMVDKLDANSYLTYLEGKKFKVAHLRAAKGKWNISEKSQRKKVIQYLQQVIRELQEADEDAHVTYTTDEEERIYGLEHRNKKELSKLAAELDIANRSKMGRQDLLNAIQQGLEKRAAEKSAVKEAAKKEAGEEKGEEKVETVPGLEDKTKDDLYRIASERSIPGRSAMKKTELLSALRQDIAKQSHPGARA